MAQHAAERTRQHLADRRTVLKTMGTAAGTGLFAGCLGGGGGGDDGPVTIGATQPFSGVFAPWGEAHSKGLQFAVDQVNENGGVLDREYNLVESDTESDPVEADTVFRRHVEEEGAVAITGAVSSDVGVRTAQTAEELEVANILHMAGSSAIINRDTRYTFRVGSHSAVTDTLSILGLIEQEGYTSVGAIMADYEWGRSFEAAITELIPDDVELSYSVAPVGESDFTPFLREMPDDIEMIAATGHPPGQIPIHNQAIELGIDPDFTTGAGFPPGVLVGGLGENATSFAHQHVANPYTDAFIEVANRFREATDERFDTHEAYGYIAGTMVANAIETAESADPTEIADAIRTTPFDSLLTNPIEYVEWGEVDNLVHMLSTFEFEAPEYFPDGDWRLTEVFRTDPLDAYDPAEWDI